MNANDITLTGTVAEQNSFCKAWPSVKSGLQLLANMVKNPIAKAAIQIVITAGDTVSAKICG